MKKSDGSADLLKWECGVPGKTGNYRITFTAPTFAGDYISCFLIGNNDF
jgi:hypothetical protein